MDVNWNNNKRKPYFILYILFQLVAKVAFFIFI